MGLSSTTNRVSYTGDGSSTIFQFPYYFFNQTDLSVSLFDTGSSIVYPQTLSTNYTISGAQNLQGVYPNGGAVVMNSSIPSNLQIVITRSPAQVQNYVLNQNGQINSVALVQQFDYITALVQRLQDQVSRSMRLKDGAGTINANSFDMTLPGNIQLPSYAAGAPVVVNSGATGWTLGVVATGASGSVSYYGILPVSNGGTGAGTFTAHSLLVGQGSSTITALAPGSAGLFLQSQGAGSDPIWQAANISGSSVSGVLAPQFGGTGGNGLAQYGILVGEGSSAIQSLVAGSSNQVLLSQSGANPLWTAVLPVSAGGTGSGSSLVNSRLIQSIGGTFAESAVVINGSNALSIGLGSLNNPGLNFLNNINSGILFYNSSASTLATVTMVASSVAGMSFTNIGANLINLGIGMDASTSATIPLQANRTQNSPVYFVFGNASTGTASGTVLQLSNGTGSNYSTIENYANANAANQPYLNGGSAFFASPNQTQLVVGAEYGSSYIGFTVGGRTLATERMRLYQNNLTLNKGTYLVFTGSTGQIGVFAASSITSYNLVLPTSQGGSNTYIKNDGSGNLSWGSITASINYSLTTQTANYNATTSDDVIIANSGAAVINLYGTSGNSGKFIRIKKGDASFNPVTINGSSATIDGANSITLNVQNEVASLICDGTNWSVVDKRQPLAWIGSSVIQLGFQGFGAPTFLNYWARKHGDSLQLKGNGIFGSTPNASSVGISWNGPMTVDYSKVSSLPQTAKVGMWQLQTTGGPSNILTAALGPHAAFLDGSSNVVYMTFTSQTNIYQKMNGSSNISGSQYFNFDFEVPITGWSN